MIVAKKETNPNNPALRNPQFAQEVFDSARHPTSWLIAGRRLRSPSLCAPVRPAPRPEARRHDRFGRTIPAGIGENGEGAVHFVAERHRSGSSARSTVRP